MALRTGRMNSSFWNGTSKPRRRLKRERCDHLTEITLACAVVGGQLDADGSISVRPRLGESHVVAGKFGPRQYAQNPEP